MVTRRQRLVAEGRRIRMQRFTIPGKLPGLNELVEANRQNRFKGALLKRKMTEVCAMSIRAARLKKVERYPLVVWIEWSEPNRKRDPDNVSSGKKHILDGLQTAGIIDNDGQRQIGSFVDTFKVDSHNPHITVSLYEDGEPLPGEVMPGIKA